MNKINLFGVFQLICLIISISSGAFALFYLFSAGGWAATDIWYKYRDARELYSLTLFIAIIFNPKCWKFAKELIFKS